MSAKLKQAWPLLLLLEKTTPKFRKLLLEDLASNLDFCALVEEIFRNVIKGNVKLSKEAQSILQQKRTLCKSIEQFKRTLPQKKKRSVLIQTGGFWPLLIPLLAEFL